MDNLSSLVEGIVSQLGRAFFMSGFVPILIGVIINQYVIFPSTATAWSLFPEVETALLGVFSAEWLTTILISLGLALAILPLNMFVIRIYEGAFPGMKMILFPFLARRRRQYTKQYGAINTKRAERRTLLAEYEESGKYNEDADYALQDELDALHHKREKDAPVQKLPYQPHRLMPTSFGNAWAVMEETPLTRYGIDSIVFWPYMRLVVSKENPDLLAQIDNQKLLIDITLHLSLVLGIVALEGLIAPLVQGQAPMILLIVICVFLFIAFYKAAVNYSRTMGMMIVQSFDIYRFKVLEEFGLERPDTLDEEYWVWTRLSAFLRRDEPFYFDLLTRAGEVEEEAEE